MGCSTASTVSTSSTAVLPSVLETQPSSVKMLSSIARSLVLTLAIGAGIAVGSPIRVRTPYAVKETHPVPAKWSRVGPAPGDHVINLSIGLKSSQFDELERHLYEGMFTISFTHVVCRVPTKTAMLTFNEQSPILFITVMASTCRRTR